MRTLAFLVVFGALAMVAVSYVLQRPSNVPLVEPSRRTGSNPQPLAPAEQPEAASAPVDGAAPGTSRAVPLAPVDDPAARLAFFYRRSPWWDARKDRYPILGVVTQLAKR